MRKLKAEKASSYLNASLLRELRKYALSAKRCGKLFGAYTESRCCPLDKKVLDPLAGLRLRDKPARPFTATYPRLRWLIGISKFWKDFWVWAAIDGGISKFVAFSRSELPQSNFKRFLLGDRSFLRILPLHPHEATIAPRETSCSAASLGPYFFLTTISRP